MGAIVMPEVDQVLDIGVAGGPLEGEARSGDAHAIVARDDGILIAVIDGLGHGDAAADAAGIAVEALTEHRAEPLDEIVRSCHLALRRTRGVVMTLAQVDPARDTLTWLGVGNVEARLSRGEAPEAGARAVETVLLLGGVVGHQLPSLRPATLAIAPGDVLVMSTDGVAAPLVPRPLHERGAQPHAQALLDGHRLQTDDALVLVARYLAVADEHARGA